MSLFLHQTTTSGGVFDTVAGCICLFSYIKPQPLLMLKHLTSVVYVSFPTSNHNNAPTHEWARVLYMSLFLHQTTTIRKI